MNTHLPDCVFVVLLCVITTCIGLTIQRVEENITTKTKIALTPIEVQCNLNDIIKISVPVINEQSLYRLHKPNGDVIKLNITLNTVRKFTPYYSKTMKVQFTNNTKVIQKFNKYTLLNLINSDFDYEEKMMENDEVMIGPLLKEDAGNWVLTVYSKDLDDYWIEFFQVISILIAEEVPLNLKKDTKFYVGDTMNISFAFPIKDIESCQLLVPSTTFDRFYTRNTPVDVNNCGFIIPKLTKKDRGTWVVIGVAKNIKYQGLLKLRVKKRKGKKHFKHGLKLFYFIDW